ncbi:MAG: PilZ domain-containing protein [Acidobacteriota bacterium]
MWCPRCKSSRIQRGYSNSLGVLRIAGLHELLCNNCGLEFKGFDPLRKLTRAPVKREKFAPNQRRFPRYKVHLPATISLVERNVLTWDVAYTQSSRGHCETISQIGMALSFVGSRFSEAQLTRPGCSLYVTVNLPDGAIAAVVSIVSWEKPAGKGRNGWFVGATISQMSDRDAARLAAYIQKQAQTDLCLALE